MQRKTLSAICVTVLLLLAGTAMFAGAGVASTDDRYRAADVPTSAIAQQEADNVTKSVNVMIGTLRLRNVTITNVSVSHVHVLGTVTTANGTLIKTPNGTEAVENITAQKLFVTNATLHNVSFAGLTIHNEPVVRALFGNRTIAGNRTGEVTIETATLENITIEGLVIEHGTVRDVHLGTVKTYESDCGGNEPGAAIPGEPAIEIHSAVVGNATVEQIVTVDLVIGNRTIGGQTTHESAES